MPKFFLIILCLITTHTLSAKDKNDVSADSLQVVDIIIKGNKITKSHIILRELSIKKHHFVHKNDLSKLLKQEKIKIFNTNLFTKTNVSYEQLSTEKITILIHVREQWYIYPIPIFELGDRNFNEWLKQRDAKFNRLEYGLKLKVKNFRGRNEKLRLLFQTGFTKKMELDYRIPYVNRKKTIGTQIGFLYAQNNSTAFKTIDNQLMYIEKSSPLLKRFSINAGISIRNQFYNRHYIASSFYKKQIADTVATLNPHYFINGNKTQSYLSIQYSFVRDFRNSIGYPTEGFYLLGNIEKKGLGVFKELNTITLRTHLAKFSKLSDRWFASNSFLSKTSFPRSQPYSELRAAGYQSYVARGFELYVIDGEHLFMTKNTLRFCLFKGEKKISRLKFVPDQFNVIPVAGYLKAYTDIFKVNNTNESAKENPFNKQWLWSIGLGFDFVTYYNLVARFEYSINSNFDRGFFFNLKTDF